MIDYGVISYINYFYYIVFLNVEDFVERRVVFSLYGKVKVLNFFIDFFSLVEKFFFWYVRVLYYSKVYLFFYDFDLKEIWYEYCMM